MSCLRGIRPVVWLLLLCGTPLAARTCLWKIASETNTVYLLGSVHLLREADYPLPDAMERAFEDASRIVFEIHPDSAEHPSAQIRMMRAGMLPEGVTLKSVLHDTVYALLDVKAQEVGFHLDFVQKMKPWMAGVLLTFARMQEAGLSPEHGVDRFFFRKAREAGKILLGLETVGFQIALFDSLASGDPDGFVLHTLKEMDLIDTQIGGLIRAWREGDVESLSALLMDAFDASPEIHDRLIVRRNADWMPHILRCLRRDENCLVVVGAAHLFGEHGLIRMLGEEGYAIEQL